MQKRPFLLIEVFIAFSLLSLSSFIFTNSQHKLFAKEKKAILDLEFERFVEMEYIELRRKVRHNVEGKFSWDQLGTIGTTIHPIQTPFHPKIRQLGSSSYSCHYHFYCAGNNDLMSLIRNLFVHYCYEKIPHSCFLYRTNDSSAQKNNNHYKFEFFVVKKQKNPV